MQRLDQCNDRLEDVARRVSLSHSQLDRLFRQHLATTPQAYRAARKLDRVRAALRGSDAPIKSIAYAEGFARLSHFSAWFAKQVGQSPRAYRVGSIEA
jgi:transcriptional regulator GlxA family with amidase domain